MAVHDCSRLILLVLLLHGYNCFSASPYNRPVAACGGPSPLRSFSHFGFCPYAKGTCFATYPHVSGAA
jgi:hypothetical protein